MAKNETQKGTVAEQVKESQWLSELGIYKQSQTKAEAESEGIIQTGVVFVEPIFEKTVGLATSSAIAFASTLGDLSSLDGLLSNLLKELNQNNFPGQPNCKIQPKIIGEVNDPPPNPDDLNFGDYAKICLDKSEIVQSFVNADLSDAANTIATIFDIISQITKPADAAECINPYFDQFFNLVPVQFILAKILKDLVLKALGNLTDQEVQEIVKDVKPCGSELEKIYTNSLKDIPEIPFPIFKLPPLPTIPNINIYTVLNKIIVEIVCYTICLIMTPTIVTLSKKLNEILQKFLTNEAIGAGSYTELMNKSLAKVNLNELIQEIILSQAIKQDLVGNYLTDLKEIIGKPQLATTKVDKNGFWKKPTSEEENKVINETISLIRKYFSEIYTYVSEPFDKKIYSPKDKKYITQQATRELGTKEILYLMMGEFNCFTIQDLIKIGLKPEFLKLRLNNEQRIRAFFEFLGNNLDPLTIISDLKAKSCPPDPCEKIEQEAMQDVQIRMSELCKVLNMDKSGLPPIPINKILATVGLQNLFNNGIKEQFKQLKTETLLWLGFPSTTSYPTIESISNFLPKEKGTLEEYDLWNHQKDTFGQDLFKKYYLRGGPPLVWKYDKFDLNQNLKNTTLEDVCSDDEPFIITFTHIFNDIFKLELNKIENSLEKKKNDYKKSFEEEVKNLFQERPVK